VSSKRDGTGRRRDSGAAAVEAALIICFLLLPLFFGILQYGFYFFQATAAEHAAREGARAAAVGIDDCGAWEELVTTRGAAADVQSATLEADAVPVVRGAELTVRVTWQPADFGLALVPFIGGGAKDETAVTRAERIGTVTAGCA
jgi:Flp pilus assembly protein TadG